MVIDRLFLWDGELYSNLFLLPQKKNSNKEEPSPGDVIELTSFLLIPPSNMRIQICSYQKKENFSYILYTPLSIQALAKPVTIQMFERYISATSRLSMIMPENRKRDTPSQSQNDKEDWRKSLDQYSSKKV